jgi:hypothetical protein
MQKQTDPNKRKRQQLLGLSPDISLAEFVLNLHVGKQTHWFFQRLDTEENIFHNKINPSLNLPLGFSICLGSHTKYILGKIIR